MTEKEYRSADGVSRSELWKIRESPEKFKYYKDNPTESTPALIFGQLFHKLLLEPDDFENEFSIAPIVDRRTKEGKQAYADFMIASKGKTVVSAEQYAEAQMMVDSVNSVPIAKKLLTGQHELPLFWADDMTGETCKVRLDVLTEVNGQPIIVDAKTTEDASFDGFTRSAIKYGYDFQAAMYSEAVEKTTGKKPLFVFVAVEKKEPYSVNIFQADEDFVQRGYDTFRELIGIYHECKQTDNWYGYLGQDSVINTLSLPNWAK